MRLRSRSRRRVICCRTCGSRRRASRRPIPWAPRAPPVCTAPRRRTRLSFPSGSGVNRCACWTPSSSRACTTSSTTPIKPSPPVPSRPPPSRATPTVSPPVPVITTSFRSSSVTVISPDASHSWRCSTLGRDQNQVQRWVQPVHHPASVRPIHFLGHTGERFLREERTSTPHHPDPTPNRLEHRYGICTHLLQPPVPGDPSHQRQI